MKSPLLSSKEDFDKWSQEIKLQNNPQPTHYPCIVIAVPLYQKFYCLDVIYYSEFQKARYVVDDNEC
jgi:hypothetical protein